MKILCLIDSVVKPGDRWLWKYLPENDDEVDFVFTNRVRDRFQKWGKLISYYPTYWHLGLRALQKTREKQYDVVVAWEGKNGFPYALLRSMLNQTTPPLVILTFIYRGLVRHFGPLARFGMRSVNHLTVTTPFELTYYPQVLSLKPEMISLCPFPWYDNQWLRPSSEQANTDRFILASGRSYRDYATLAKAVQGLDLKVLLLARKFNLAGMELPSNVQTMDLLPLREYQTLLHQAQFVVLPLMDLPHAAGDSHIVQSMSASKAIIASRTPSPEAYIQSGVNGILVPPHDVKALREAILHLWQSSEEATRMGQAARCQYEENYTFAKVGQRVQGILQKVHNGQIE